MVYYPHSTPGLCIPGMSARSVDFVLSAAMAVCRAVVGAGRVGLGGVGGGYES